MGKLLSKIFGNKEMRILMLGLDAAGKTSILLKNKHGQCRSDDYFNKEMKYYFMATPFASPLKMKKAKISLTKFEP